MFAVFILAQCCPVCVWCYFLLIIHINEDETLVWPNCVSNFAEFFFLKITHFKMVDKQVKRVGNIVKRNQKANQKSFWNLTLEDTNVLLNS